MTKLNYSEIEPKWRKYWEENKINKTDNDFSNNKKKFYILDMFPYPSGEGLHVGHPKGYIATDVYSRLKKMQGYNVLHPMGWDAFGLPAEQFAIKNKINPNIATAKNVARYKEQIEMLGLNYDWDREVNTTDPKFYKWTQWMWKQMYKDGLAYESFEPINWCPSCKTGLSNEDLDGNACERCGTIVEKKPLRQWVIKITDYADRLLTDIDKLNWEPHIKESQRNWIGKSVGSEIDFEILNPNVFGFDLKTIYDEDKENYKSDRKRTVAIIKIKGTDKFLGFKKPNDAHIYLPGGGKEFGENCIENAIRETKEEIGLTGLVHISPIATFRNGEYYELFEIEEGYKTLPSELDQKGNILVEFTKEEILKNDFAQVSYIFNNLEDLVKKSFKENKLKIFTTRADTLFGCTFMCISYTLAKEWIMNGWVATPEIKNFIAKLEKEEKERTVDFDMSKLEKEGVDTGIKAVNPANGEEVPIYIANYILSDYGTGAIMAVPAHDERDFEFAKKYNLEIKYVIIPSVIYPHEFKNDSINSYQIDFISLEKEKGYDSAKDLFLKYLRDKNQPHLLNGRLIDSGSLSGLINYEASDKITEKVGGKVVSKYKLKDWVFARQRYWGEPFPIVFDENRKSFSVADKELPVILPNVENYEPTDNGESPLANIKDWVEVYGFINEAGEFESYNSIVDENPLEFFGEGEDSIKEGLEIIDRPVIDVIIKDKEGNFYFVKDKNLGVTLVGGGIDDNSDIEAVKREIEEETGFYDFEIKAKLKRKIIWNGYHVNKKRNQKCWGYCYVVELNNTDRKRSEIEEGREDGTHELVKFKKEEALEKINFNNHKIFFKDYLDGNFIEIKKFYRETNTMPQWAGSSWYYLRYIDPKNENIFADKDLEKNWSPVDFYVGGAEHATRHLIYARFWHKFLFDKGFLSYDEPFSKLQTVGLIMAEDGKKMSKRYGNVVNPDDVVKEFGADAMRTYEMFMGPFEKAIAWNTNSIAGVSRFLERVYALFEKVDINNNSADSKDVEFIINQTIKKVGEDIENFKFNTAISQMMICLNSFEEEIKKGNKISKKTLSDFIQILSPFAVHICEEIWQNVLGNNFSVHTSIWPEYDEAKIVKDEVEMSIQISGKFRGTFAVKSDASDEEIKDLVKTSDIYKKYITEESQIKKIIIVPKRLINIVI